MLLSSLSDKIILGAPQGDELFSPAPKLLPSKNPLAFSQRGFFHDFELVKRLEFTLTPSPI